MLVWVTWVICLVLPAWVILHLNLLFATSSSLFPLPFITSKLVSQLLLLTSEAECLFGSLFCNLCLAQIEDLLLG